MTLWEYQHCKQGFEDFHRTEEAPTPAMDEDKLSRLGIEGF